MFRTYKDNTFFYLLSVFFHFIFLFHDNENLVLLFLLLCSLCFFFIVSGFVVFVVCSFIVLWVQKKLNIFLVQDTKNKYTTLYNTKRELQKQNKSIIAQQLICKIKNVLQLMLRKNVSNFCYYLKAVLCVGKFTICKSTTDFLIFISMFLCNV